MTPYIIATTIGLGVSYLLFLLFLKKEKSFRFNRVYLLGSLALCLVAPTLEIDFGNSFSKMPKIEVEEVASNFFVEETPDIQTVEVVEKQENWFLKTVPFVCMLISVLFLIRFSRNLLQIFHRTKPKGSFQISGLRIIILDGKHHPHSFFHFLFVDGDDFKNGLSETLVEHELAHSRQFHSADVVFVELLLCLFWFNPFLWLYKKAIVENHEFLADESVVKKGIDANSYSLQLVKTKNKNFNFPLVSGFNFNLTKNRIIMLYKKRSSKTVLTLKTGMVLGLFALVFTFVACTSEKTNPEAFVVVVDAGHGGHDTGVSNEKTVNLQIAQKLAALSKEGEVQIILTRDEDEFISLYNRVDFIKKQNADMMLSLHCNSAKDKAVSGVEAFYPRNGGFTEQSHEYSKILVSNYLGEITDEGGKINTAGFIVLRDLGIPGIMLELGFLSNPEEAQQLQNPEFQQKIAENIYESLLEISELQ